MVHVTGLQNARLRLIRALRTGHWVHEERDVRSEKNLLAIGDVTPEDVILMLQRTRGHEYSGAAVFISVHPSESET